MKRTKDIQLAAGKQRAHGFVRSGFLLRAALALVFTLTAAFTGRADLYITYGTTKLGLFTDTGVWVRDFATDLSNPQGVAVDPVGNVYVSDLGNSRIRMYNKVGNFVRNVMTPSYGGGTPRPIGLAWNPSADKLAATVSGTASGTHIVNFDVTTENSASGVTGFGGNYEGLTYADNGHLYATVTDVSQFFTANPVTYGGTWFPNTGGALKGIAIKTSVDRKYIADMNLGKVFITGGTDITGLSAPCGVIYVSSLDTIFVAEIGASLVHRYSDSGSPLASFAVAGPVYMAYTTNTVHSVTVQTNLYIGYEGTKLGRFTSAGVKIADLATDLNNPQGVAVDPVGNVYVSDLGNSRIRMYDSSGNFVRNVMTSAYGGTGSPQPFALTWNRTTGKLSATVANAGGAYGSKIVDFDVRGTDLASGATDVGGNYEGLCYAGSVSYATVGPNIQWFNNNPYGHAGSLVYTGISGSEFKGFAYNAGADRKIVADFGAGKITHVGWNDPVDIDSGLSGPMGVIYISSSDQVIATEWKGGKVNTYNFTTHAVQASFDLSAPGYLACRTELGIAPPPPPAGTVIMVY